MVARYLITTSQMISNEYGDVRKVQVRRTTEFEYLHNYGWIQSEVRGCVGRDGDATLRQSDNHNQPTNSVVMTTSGHSLY